MKAPANKKSLNIIAKNPYGETIYAESITKDLNKFKTIEDTGRYLKKKMTWPACVICKYDKSTQQSLLVHDAFSKKGQIDWNLRTEEMNIETAFNASQNHTITIIGICFEKALGLGCTADTILNIIDFLKLIAWFFVAIYSYVFPFRTMHKKYKVNENYVKDTIKISNRWNKGFLSTDNFRHKKIIEYSIMRKLGYRAVDGKWINDRSELRFKFPDEIVKGE